ncbi:MAG: hypothetical protein VXW02_06645 [Verrucomicrobiota bacterium]|nr:hypothetical protein [Verrucomicrobiota bacterium]
MSTICETQAQITFRTFKTVSQQETFVDRERILKDGTRETFTEVVIKTIETELTPNPVTSQSTTEEETKEVTLFLEKEAADDLKAKIEEKKKAAEEDEEVELPDTFIDDIVKEEVEEKEKVVDETTGEVAKQVEYVEKNEDGTDKTDETGEIVTATKTDDVVVVEKEAVTERTEVEVIVVKEKKIVSNK